MVEAPDGTVLVIRVGIGVGAGAVGHGSRDDGEARKLRWRSRAWHALSLAASALTMLSRWSSASCSRVAE